MNRLCSFFDVLVKHSEELRSHIPNVNILDRLREHIFNFETEELSLSLHADADDIGAELEVDYSNYSVEAKIRVDHYSLANYCEEIVKEQLGEFLAYVDNKEREANNG